VTNDKVIKGGHLGRMRRQGADRDLRKEAGRDFGLEETKNLILQAKIQK